MTNKTKFQFSFPENLKRDGNLPVTRQISFDDLGDFVEEREKIKRLLERNNRTELKVDYSDFANHVFFDSAVQKFNITKNKILNKYPYYGSSEDKDNFILSSSGYENYVIKYQWPKYVGYVQLSGNQYISASDYDTKLFLGSSSLYTSMFIKPAVQVSGTVGLLEVVSSSTGPVRKHGYDLILSGTIPQAFVKFTVYSGSMSASISSSYVGFSATFNNVAAIYDKPASLLSLYIGSTRVAQVSTSVGPVEFRPEKVYVGSGSIYRNFSGALDEVRIFHTASELFHFKNYNRTVNSEDFLKLKYSFNESITSIDSVDAVVVDYSQNPNHAKIVNYSSGTRVSGSSMLSELGDPILYSFHPTVISFTGTMYESASFYDNNNDNFIFNLIGQDILREDGNEDGLLTSFSLAMARYFDELKSYIDQFENIKVTNYENQNEVPDLFLPYLKQYFGWKVTEHFNDSNPLEFFFGENILGSGSLQIPLFEIRNQFWRRVLNNLPYLYSTKGKRNNIDSMFNIFGLNKENIDLKEYGYLAGGTLQEERIHKEKAVSILGITGSISSSFIRVPGLVSSSNTTYTIESYVQLPFVSSSYTASFTSGSLWQFTDRTQVTGSYALIWQIPSVGSTTGKFILTSSDGQFFSSSDVAVFDGDFVYIAAGIDASRIPFIELRTLDNDSLDLTASFTGTVAFSGVFTGSNYDFIIGATSGTLQKYYSKGYFSEYRVWSRKLSGSEFNAHALHFENVGINDPNETPHPLRGHWPLNDNLSASSIGALTPINDFSRTRMTGSGVGFTPLVNPYKKFLQEYNYISPSVDLKWTENKIRIRNKTYLKKQDIANDTNEVALEFNLVDALNEDIMKIFSSFDVLHNAIGNPINKYRDEYSDLEGIRTTYFNRLGDSIHFNNFFRLFTWFDKKISDSIKQLLPTRVKFIGGEQVIESHFLERPRYKYQYPVFRTPVDIPNADITVAQGFSSTLYLSFNKDDSIKSEYVNSFYEKQRKNNFSQFDQEMRPLSATILREKTFEFTYNTFFSSSTTLKAEEKPTINKILVHPSGIFAVGTTMIGSSFSASYVTIASTGTNTGASGTWAILDSVNDQTVTHMSQSFFTARSIAIDKSGTMYTVGTIFSGNKPQGVIRRSHLSSSNIWSTVYSITSSFNPEIYFVGMKDIAIDINDTVYTAGYCEDSNGDPEWLIFSSSNRGTNWSMVDRFSTNGAPASHCIATSGTYVFVGGYANINSSARFTIRSSSNGLSGTFGTILIYTGSVVNSNTLSNTHCANDIFVDISGILYACGAEANNPTTNSNTTQAVLLRSTNGGSTWGVVDIFSASFGVAALSNSFMAASASGQFITQDSSGSIYWGGSWSMSSTIDGAVPRDVPFGNKNKWFVRKSITGNSASFTTFLEFSGSLISGSNNSLNTMAFSGSDYYLGGGILEGNQTPDNSVGNNWNGLILRNYTFITAPLFQPSILKDTFRDSCVLIDVELMK